MNFDKNLFAYPLCFLVPLIVKRIYIEVLKKTDIIQYLFNKYSNDPYLIKINKN